MSKHATSTTSTALVHFSVWLGSPVTGNGNTICFIRKPKADSRRCLNPAADTDWTLSTVWIAVSTQMTLYLNRKRKQFLLFPFLSCRPIAKQTCLALQRALPILTVDDQPQVYTSHALGPDKILPFNCRGIVQRVQQTV